MALFGISRYLGEDSADKSQKTKDAQKATSILEKLHQEASLRKQKQNVVTQDIKQTEIDRDGSPKKKRKDNDDGHMQTAKSHKRKKEKLSTSDKDEQVTSANHSMVDTDTSPGQLKCNKKEKKKKSGDAVSNTTSNVTSDNEISNTSVGHDSMQIASEDASPNHPKQKSKKKHSDSKSDDSSSDMEMDSILEAIVNTTDTSSSHHTQATLKSRNTKSKDTESDSNADDSDSNQEEDIEQGDDQDQSVDTTEGEVGGFTVIGETHKKKVQKVQRVLPEWLTSPSVISADIRNSKVPLASIKGLDEEMMLKLKDNGISHFFPVQSQVIPALLGTTASGCQQVRGGYRPSDVCCSAPTGSGKTLAFVLPIVQVLKSRVVCRVRALVVLPVTDLATQVFKVFQTYCQGTNLKVGLIIGQKAFSSEQQSLVKKGVRGALSLVDIVVATPGRLVDHINQTPGFSLTHLRFLVIDEADRIMDEIKQDWLQQVENAVFSHQEDPQVPGVSQDGEAATNNKDQGHQMWPCNGARRHAPGPLTAASASRMEIPLQKLLFSATLSQNPEKLQQLNLFQPKLFTSVTTSIKKKVDPPAQVKESDAEKVEVPPQPEEPQEKQGEFVGKYTTPTGLSEFFVESSVSEKALVLLHLIHHLKFKQVLCFTNSVESTHRLFHLIRLVGGDVEVREFSSSLHALKRGRILKQFAAGKIHVLICSDAMARGMDVENVRYVVSYEAPSYVKTYIHRVGRTARAGKVGMAITLLEKKEIYHFKKMMTDAGKEGVKEMKIGKPDLKALVEAYQGALQELPGVLKGEKRKR